MFQKIKERYDAFAQTKIGREIISAFHTFVSIFIGSLVFSPIINQFINLDLPTIGQVKDIIPVLIDTFFRSLWMTFLVATGLAKLRN